MKNKILLFLLLFAISTSYAQNWSCIPPDAKTYFTNGSGYLRGLRIDSVKTIEAQTVYFPFKVPRAPTSYFWEGILAPDTSGGHWLGEEIIETGDGFTLIPTFYGDTLKIYNLANIGDSWTLLDDTLGIYYTATVTNIDTMTRAGINDSVKVMEISAHNTGTTTNPFHGQKIALSKNNGWFRVMDLYMFPVRGPRDTFIGGVDFDYITRIYFSGSWSAEKNNFFERTYYRPATIADIYDFQEGDVIHTEIDGNYTDAHPPTLTFDTVLARLETDTSVIYNFGRRRLYIRNPGGPPPYSMDTTVYFEHYTSEYSRLRFLYDTTYMPEEWDGKQLFRYSYLDSSFCTKSDVFEPEGWGFQEDGAAFEFEPVNSTGTYKCGVGLVDARYSSISAEIFSSKRVIYVKKNGISCDVGNALSLKSPAKKKESFTCFPNPAKGQVLLEYIGEDQGKYDIALYDLSGRQLRKEHSVTKQYNFSLWDISPGLYLIRLSTSAGQSVYKLVVE